MKIVAIGDSITEGYPYSQRESWVEYLARKLSCEVINQGICGDLTSGMRERFKRDVLNFNPTHVIILGGTNDAAAGFPLERVKANFEAMIKMSKEQEIMPILALPIPSFEEGDEGLLKEYRKWIKGYAAENNILLLDFYSSFQNEIAVGRAVQLYAGEVHPSLKGYRLMGETAIKQLNESLLF